MKNKILNYFVVIILIMTGMLATYDNPKLVEIPKKNFKYFLKKVGLIDSFHIEKDQQSIKNKDEEKDKKKQEFLANSFSFSIEKIKSLNRKTASLIFNKEGDYKIFTQRGELVTKKLISEINLPIDFTIEKEGGVKSVFSFEGKSYALLSRKSLGCSYSSLLNLKNQNEIFKTKCIQDIDKINFAGLGGAYIYYKDGILLSVGTPTHYSDKIDELAQKNNSLYGKILFLKTSEQDEKKLIYSIFSKGHRNPQGMVLINEKIYSTEHGPQGGDELNLIEKDANYGWPIVSLGTRYGGKSYKKESLQFKEPIFSFSPAIAPSALNICPRNLKEYYKDYTCFIGLTLKEMSLVIYLINKDEELISYEKIKLDKRLRHFGLNEDATLYLDKEDNFYFSSDGDGIYRAKFEKFR